MFCALLTSRYQVSVYRTNGPLVSTSCLQVGLLLFSIGNHGVRFCQINCGAVDLWAWDNSCARIPPTHLSAALQIGSDVGFRSLRMEVDWFSDCSGP